MANVDYWLAKTSAGWTVENQGQVLAVHATRRAAAAHLDRLANPGESDAQPLDVRVPAPPDMPRADAFFRRFS